MSLGLRLALGLGLSLVLLFAAQIWVVGFEVRQLSHDMLGSRLEHDIEEILTALEPAADGQMQFTPGRLSTIYNRPFSGHYFVVHTGGQTIHSRSLWDENLPEPGIGLHHGVGPQGQPLLLLTRSFKKDGRSIGITVAEDTSTFDDDARHFQHRLLLLALVIFFGLLTLQAVIVRLSLSSLNKVRQELRQLERGETEQLSQTVPAEIQPLVDEVNRLLVLMRQRLQRSRNALGNLAHALKTPLTLIGQALQRGEAVDEEARQRLLGHVGDIQQRIDRELSKARLAGLSHAGVWNRPKADLEDVAKALMAVHAGRLLAVAVNVPPHLHIAADREDMLELAGNLMDNACKWSKTRVDLMLERQPEALVIRVEDDGPGMEEAEMQQLLQRGVRADESIPGHGLGLAVVHDIVSAYGGDISFGHSGLGGLSVVVTLPQTRGGGRA